MKRADGWTRSRVRRMTLVVSMGMILASFTLMTVSTNYFVSHHHPGGGEVYVLAALPTFPIVCMLAVFGMYLASERDEFKKAMVVRSLLWAIGAALAVGAFLGYARAFGGVLRLPAFSELAAFWVMFGIVYLVQMRWYRAESDE